MDNFLIPINHVEDAPSESYVIYKISGGLYYCENKNYTILSRQLSFASNSNGYLTMDLSSTQGHAFVFDIDIKFSSNSKSSRYPLLSYYDKIFSTILKTHFGRLKHFTVLVALRENFVGGMHIHLPEFTVSYDDYVEFCNQIQTYCSFSLPEIDANIELDIVCNFSLAKCSKPNSSYYVPVLLIYYDEKHSHTIDLSQGLSKFMSDLQKVKKNFKIRKNNENSLFRKLLAFEHFPDMIHRLFELMMPVVVLYKPIYKLTYSTSIVPIMNEEIGDNDFFNVGIFVYNNRKRYVIRKKLNEIHINEKDWLKCYKYLNFNSYAISEFESKNRALNLWYKRNKRKVSISNCITDIFTSVNQDLIVDNYNFHSDPNPLRTILTYENGYFFLPVFYALCNHLKQSSNVIAAHLRPTFDDNLFIMQLLEKLERIDPKLIENISQDFTLYTILYCGSNLREKKSCRFQEKIRSIIAEMKNFLEQADTIDEIIDLIRKIQERHYPIMNASIRHSCKKAQMYNWNLTHEYWQVIDKESHVEKSVSVIWSTIMEFMRKTLSKVDYAVWMDGIGKSINIKLIVDALLYEAYQDRKTIEMDRHKWHIRTNDGILDLLTGHVGATVPEFYMSERRLSVSFDRQDLLNIRDKNLELLQVYKTLTDRIFFQKYLKCLFENVTDDLFDTLLYLVHSEKKEIDSQNDCIISMYQFYVHLCKYTSFEYDRMMYMLDVVASLLVATNYMRKFFILKGVTKNGKSKFFQMISRIFGGYSYTARSVNLQNNQSQGLNAMPELASSLFGCRVITVEELSGKLNENLIKEITGNSATSFRNLYEQNSGGIPTAKIFASTNTFPECTATEAFRDRVVAIPFDAKFCREAKDLTTAQMVLQEKYILETNDSIIEDSHKGFFIMAYLHLTQNVDLKDGTLHYRAEPEAFVEFKEEILFMTDIYIQFKQYMDVQYIPNSTNIVTFNELKSAIRHFLKSTKNSSVQEADLVVRFDEEFKDVKKMTLNDTEDEMNNEFASLLDQPSESLVSRYDAQMSHDPMSDSCKRKAENESEEDLKKQKLDNENENNGIVYYDGVIIRNQSKVTKHNR